MSQTLSIEQLKYSYFDENALRHPSYEMYRVNTPKGRYYYTFDKRKKVKFYISVTNILNRFTPTPDYLIKWIAQQGEEGAEKKKNQRAAYGTLMHNTIEEFIINNGKIDLDDLPNRVHKYFQENDTWGAKEEEFTDELYKDITGFAQFMIDRDVKPIAVEVILKSDKFKIAGAVDLFCELNFNRKRVKAIVDFKGSKKGFYEDNELQLEYYKHALLEEWTDFNYNDIMLFNWAGKNWKTKPDYKLKNQTNLHSKKELKLYSDLYREKTKQYPVENIPIIDFFGKIDISKKSLEDNYSVISLNKKVKNHDKNQKPRTQQNQNTSSNNRKGKNRRQKTNSGRKRVSDQPGLFQSNG
jgi:hypothetical protein